MMLLKNCVWQISAKVNNNDTSGFALKTKYDTDKSELKNKIPDISGLVKKTEYNAKITEIENKIPGICALATTSVLTAVENKIPNISSLVKKTDYNTNIIEIEKKLTDHNHDKYVTNPEFDKLLAEVFDARLARQILMINWKVSIKKLTQIKQNIDSLKMNWKNYKHLIQFILEEKVILKKMVHKII